jgi:hypothetical protein
MKTDRELLELAARAAGIHLSFKGSIPYLGTGLSAYIWDPLGDDGDALRLAVRLAVRLRLCVSVEHDAQVAWWCGDSLEQANESLGNDEFSATRRAIVRAAAAIGEAM